jgi:hypothetical protein
MRGESEATGSQRRMQAELLKVFKNALNSRGEDAARPFKSLCKDGCDPEELSRLLFVASTLSRADKGQLVNFGNISKGQLKNLSRNLQSLAEVIERINNSPLSPQANLGAMFPNEVHATTETGRFITEISMRCKSLPGSMRIYDDLLCFFYDARRKALKRLTLERIAILQLLEFVQDSTGGPRCEALASLLEQGFFAVGGDADRIPKLFTAEALSKLNHRRKVQRAENLREKS